jgi:23S rRNA pseudouridine1911/1915/1917 synthase
VYSLVEALEFVGQDGVRLDNFLAQNLEQTRSQIAQLIKKGYVHVDAKEVKKPGIKLKNNQKIFVSLPVVTKVESEYEVNFEVEILYEDDALLVINKPSGVTVHSAPSVKEATLVDWLKQKGISLSTISGEERHGIVHRLDKGTSGVMVVAKTNEAHQHLAKQLEEKTMGRYYLAVITPKLKEFYVEVEAAIGRNPNNRIKMACIEGGKNAKSAFLALCDAKDDKTQLIACKLFTGRTHQIRVHLEKLGRHILGDSVYGQFSKNDSTEQILLHAYTLYFIHPITGKHMQIVANFDGVFKKVLEKKFEMEIVNEKIEPQCIIDSFNTALV